MRRMAIALAIVTMTVTAAMAKGMEKFKGFDDPRYYKYDQLILRYTAEFNRHRGAWADANRKQAKTIPDIDPMMIRAHLLEETGGGDYRSMAAWKADPLQVNVPGDWTKYKSDIGLKQPVRRNEGKAEKNIAAAIKFLVRKGFGRSGQPVRNSDEECFGGWRTALEMYNGRSDELSTGALYREVYADNILRRAANPKQHVPIGVKK